MVGTEIAMERLVDALWEIKQSHPYLVFEGLKKAFGRVKWGPPDLRITETKTQVFRSSRGDESVLKVTIPGYTFKLNARFPGRAISLLYSVCYEPEEIEGVCCAEEKAQNKLRTLISEKQMRQYSLTSTFIERSKRSGLTYLLRRGFPTLVYKDEDGGVRFIVGLCLHVQAHERHSWRGALCPTDDVIAHFLLIRGDERKFWAKSTHHTLKSNLLGI